MPQPDPFIGRDILGGQFQIQQKVGSGGMGAVYKALEPEMNRMVGVKILHPKLANRKDLVSRFRREARALSQLNHPNTVKVFRYGELEDGALYIIMEFLEGKNLNQTVRADGPFSTERALPILIQVCGALDEAHRAGIIHRDLKPENIFLVQGASLHDFPKVLDFGLAKVGERQMRPGSVILTQEGMVFGTPEFMSPEQAQGRPLTSASDIYSLAIILYEVLTAKLPFDAKSAMDYIQLHASGRPISLNQRVAGRTFSPLLENIMDRALAKRPEDRFASAADFAESMQAVLQGAVQLPLHVVSVARAPVAAPQALETPASSPPAAVNSPAGLSPSAHGVATVPMGAPVIGESLRSPEALRRRSAPSALPRTGMGLLVAVAIAFLLLGVALALVGMRYLMR
jgi:serine/threonine protein kinase